MAFSLSWQSVGGQTCLPYESQSPYLEKLCNADVYLPLEVLLLCNCGCQFSLSIHFVFDGQLPAAARHTCICKSEASALHSQGSGGRVCVILVSAAGTVCPLLGHPRPGAGHVNLPVLLMSTDYNKCQPPP